jgi:hypothetical protein
MAKKRKRNLNQRPLNERDLEIARASFEGVKRSDICQQFKISGRTLERLIATSPFQAELERLREVGRSLNESAVISTAEFEEEIRQNTRQIYRDLFGKIQDAIEILDPVTTLKSISGLVRATKELTELALATSGTAPPDDTFTLNINLAEPPPDFEDDLDDDLSDEGGEP